MTGRMVRADEIRWTPFAPAVDLLMLDDQQLFDYARGLQDDCRILASVVSKLLVTICQLRRDLAAKRGAA